MKKEFPLEEGTLIRVDTYPPNPEREMFNVYDEIDENGDLVQVEYDVLMVASLYQEGVAEPWICAYDNRNGIQNLPYNEPNYRGVFYEDELEKLFGILL